MTAPGDSRVHALTRAGVAAALAVAREQETCRGPREWDLMVLARSAASARGTGASEVALTAYAAVTSTPVPSPER
jgi:hypothetical protein